MWARHPSVEPASRIGRVPAPEISPVSLEFLVEHTESLLRGIGYVKSARNHSRSGMPGPLPVVISAFVLRAVAVVASVLPAERAARVDVMQALRSE